MIKSSYNEILWLLILINWSILFYLFLYLFLCNFSDLNLVQFYSDYIYKLVSSLHKLRGTIEMLILFQSFIVVNMLWFRANKI